MRRSRTPPACSARAWPIVDGDFDLDPAIRWLKQHSRHIVTETARSQQRRRGHHARRVAPHARRDRPHAAGAGVSLALPACAREASLGPPPRPASCSGDPSSPAISPAPPQFVRGRRVLRHRRGRQHRLATQQRAPGRGPRASLVLLDHHEHSLFSLERASAPPSARLQLRARRHPRRRRAAPHLRRRTDPSRHSTSPPPSTCPTASVFPKAPSPPTCWPPAALLAAVDKSRASRRSSTRPATRASSRRASTAPPSASPKAWSRPPRREHGRAGRSCAT